MLALYNSGENYRDIDDTILEDEYFIGYGYNESNYRYLKFKSLSDLPRKEVVALGSSRVLQYRKQMFATSFYNAGYTIDGIKEFAVFMKAIPKEKYPKYLIISLDQWMFNKNWDDLSEDKKPEYWSGSFTKNADIKTITNVWGDILKGKYGITFEKSDVKKIGLNANVNNKGFRSDGSMYYGSQIEMLLNNDENANDFNYSETLNRIKKGKSRFEYGDEVNEEALEALDKFLLFCKQNDIYVIGFLPPYADKVNAKMAETGKYSYIKEIYPKAKPYFEKYNFEFYNFTHLSDVGSGDSETIDGFHGSETAYLRILIKMLEEGSALKNTTSLPKLKNDLESRKNGYSVYTADR